MELEPYRGTWNKADRHANFKSEVAQYSRTDPLPTLERLSKSTGIPVGSLVRYILVKWAASGSEILMLMTPIVLRQMEQQVEQAESAGTDAARVKAYEALKGITSWLRAGADKK